MVTKCANSSCGRPFLYLRGGRLFLIEPAPLTPEREMGFQESLHRREYFWLCEKCAPTMTVVLDRNGHAVASPIQDLWSCRASSPSI
jgi:hypothetical protein